MSQFIFITANNEKSHDQYFWKKYSIDTVKYLRLHGLYRKWREEWLQYAYILQ